jgi:hypothetical protein
MYPPLSSVSKPDLQALIAAIAHAPTEDRLDLTLPPLQWETLGAYLLPQSLEPGQVLFQRDQADRTLYFVESGTLSVHLEDEKGRLRLAMVGAGSVVGEGAFFSTCRAAPPCRQTTAAGCGAWPPCASSNCRIASLAWPWRSAWPWAPSWRAACASAAGVWQVLSRANLSFLRQLFGLPLTTFGGKYQCPCLHGCLARSRRILRLKPRAC